MVNKVFVYYNLHKHCWSIRALDGPKKGLVIHHASYVRLGGSIEPTVSERGRQRVLEQKSKNVHAGIKGTLLHHIPFKTGANPKVITPSITSYKQITYNPYLYNEFVFTKTKKGLPKSLSACFMTNDRQVFVN